MFHLWWVCTSILDFGNLSANLNRSDSANPEFFFKKEKKMLSKGMSSSSVIYFSSTLLKKKKKFIVFHVFFKKMIFIHEPPNLMPVTIYDFFHRLKFRPVKI